MTKALEHIHLKLLILIPPNCIQNFTPFSRFVHPYEQEKNLHSARNALWGPSDLFLKSGQKEDSYVGGIGGVF